MGTADSGISKHLPLAELQELQRPGPGGHLALATGDFQGPSSPGLGLCRCKTQLQAMPSSWDGRPARASCGSATCPLGWE